MIPTSFFNLPAPTRPADREAVRRAEAAQAFPGRRARGLGVDFTARDTAVAKTSNMGGSALDLYAPVVRAEDARREELARRMDALPVHIAALPQKQPGLAVDALEALAVIERSAKAMNGPVAVTRGDIARAIKTSPERAEAIVQDLERRKLLRRQATTGVLDYFTVQL